MELIAHRGLFNKTHGLYDNNLDSLTLAVNQKFSIELDVRLTKDHEVIMIHDPSIYGLFIDKYNYSTIKKKFPFITKFDEFLNIVNKTPTKLYVELKSIESGRNLLTKRDRILADKVVNLLSNYSKIEYVIISMNPELLKYIDFKYKSSIPLGVISYNFNMYRPTIGDKLADELQNLSILDTHSSMLQLVNYQYQISDELIDKTLSKELKLFTWTYRTHEDLVASNGLKESSGISFEPSITKSTDPRSSEFLSEVELLKSTIINIKGKNE